MTDGYLNNLGGEGLSELGAQAREQFSQAQDKAINNIVNLSTVQSKGGKHYWMGIELSPEMALLMTHATSSAPNFLNDAINGGVYKHAFDFHNFINKHVTGKADLKASHRAGIRAAGGVMGLLIGLQPAASIIQSVKNRSNERRDIRKSIESIIESNGNYEDNEVIKTAMERTNKIMVAGFKGAASQLPMVLAGGYLALGNHRAMVKEKNGEFLEKEKARSISSNPKAMEEFFERRFVDDDKLAGIAKKQGISTDSERFKEMREEWKEYSGFQHEKPDSNDAGSHKVDPKTQNFINMGALVGNVFMQRLVSKDSEAEFSKPTAYALIMNLKNAITNGDVSQGSDITSYVVDIFQQNEVDRGRSKIGNNLLKKFEPLAQSISEEISSGQLDALALINLVGEGKIVNKRRFVGEGQLESLLDEQKKRFGSKENTPLDDLLANFQSPDMIMKAVKDNLKNLEGDEKALFASLLSDDVLIRSNVDKKEIPLLRERGFELSRNFIINTAHELGKKSSEELLKANFSEEQIEGIRSINELMEQGQEKEVKAAASVDGNAASAVRYHILGNLGKDDKKLWVDAVKTARNKPKIEKRKPMIEAVEEDGHSGHLSAAERVNARRGVTEMEAGI